MYAELTRRCIFCDVIKPIEEFHRNGARRKDGTSGPRTDCKACSTEVHRRYVEKNKDRINEKRRKNYQNLLTGIKLKVSRAGVRTRYNLSDDQYRKMLQRQKGRCAICHVSQDAARRRFDVDHCHKTGIIRGLLCIRCNRGIGLLRDDFTIIKRAMRYLKKSKK